MEQKLTIILTGLLISLIVTLAVITYYGKDGKDEK